MNPATATRATDPRTSEILAVENERRRALESQDFSSLAKLFAEDVVYTHTTGEVQDKDAYLAYVQSGKLTFLSIDRGDLNIRFFGDVAVSTGKMTNTIRALNVPEPVVVNAMVTQVFARRNGAWQHIVFQATRLPPPAA